DFKNVGFNKIVNTESIKIYPNPNKGLFAISFNDSFLRQIFVFDRLGNLVSTFVSAENTINVNLLDKAKGIYFVKVLSDKGELSSKIVVE
ncbi:MAG: T9SS C-terminal target domain-containing protein, partial [Bacteroidetes bacterium]